MLDEYRQLYLESANLIPGWKNIRRSDLAFKYVEEKEKNSILADSYLSALILKFWNVAESNYYRQDYKYANQETCYEWVVDSIFYVLTKHVWTDPSSNLYQDENAPEKAINVAIVSARQNFHTARKTAKRSINYLVDSLERLQEDSPEGIHIPYNEPDNSFDDYIVDKVRAYINTKQDISAFALDTIATVDDLFERCVIDGETWSVFNEAKLRKYIRHIPDSYIKTFSLRYGLREKDVEKSLKYVRETTYDAMVRGVNAFFKDIKKDRRFIKALKGEN